VAAPERGIAQTRNVLIATALARSRADYIAMLDDDCRPDPGWLAALMEIIAETGADMANGRVAHAIEGGAEDAAGAFWDRLRRPRPRGPVDHLLGGIALLSRSVFERIEPPWFEPQYGLSGGEDEDFFLRAAAAGCTAAYTPDAVVSEFVPAPRMTPRYLIARAFAQGMTYTHIRRRRRPAGWSAGIEVVRIAAALGLGAAGYVLLFWSPRHRRRAAWRIARAAGKACGMTGRLADFYRSTHGR
jgi:glycosyltransferase involved in cell wall biosynthesis